MALSPVIKPYMYYNNGTILVVQIENEYGSWGRQDRDYVDYIEKTWVDNGITGPFFTADALDYVNQNNHPDDAAVGMNGYYGVADFQKANEKFPTVPAMSTELYPGWLRHWYEGDWGSTDVTGYITTHIQNNFSFNIYVIHGGTNFGLTAGANNNGEIIQPDVTSYDYGSPITEQGLPTSLYQKYREAIQDAIDEKLIDIPDPIPVMNLSSVELKKVADIWAQTPQVSTSDDAKHFEFFDQNQNFISYETTLATGSGGILKFDKLRDYSKIYLNGNLIGTINRCKTDKYEIQLPDISEPGKLEVMVEAFGHINYGMIMETDRKGIVGDVTFNGEKVTGWTHKRYIIADMLKNLNQSIAQPDRTGGIFQGQFTTATAADTYISFEGFTKGYLIVNGYNLGRYWSVGPQKRLYCPGVYLKTDG